MAKKEASQQEAPVLTLKDKVQILFNMGLTCTYGQSFDPPAPQRGRSAIYVRPEQPTLSWCIVKSLHDGGAWIAMTLGNGETVRTTQAEELRVLAKNPHLLNSGKITKLIHFERVVGLRT